MDIGDWTSLIMGIAGLLVAAISAPASAARRRPALIASGGLVVVALGIALAGLLGPVGGWLPTPSTPSTPPTATTPTAATTATTAPQPTTAPLAATADNYSRWAGTVHLTSRGLDLDRIPEASSESGAGNDLILMTPVGGSPYMMLVYRSAVWPSAGNPTSQQCAEQLATQPIDQFAALNFPVKHAALCLATSEKNMAFFRVTGTTDTGNSPYGLSGAVVAEVTTWRSPA